MPTVNFQCDHCHNLMAVGEENLGQQVRCPHCQEVVLAPAPASPPAEEPWITTPGPADHEDSIFSVSEPGDDLFGEPAPPRVEMPSEPAFPRLAFDEQTAPASSPVDVPTLTYAGPEPLPSTEVAPPAAEGTPTPPEPGPFPPTESAPAAPPEEGLPGLRIEPKARPSRGNPWVIPLFIAPLIFYSILATVYILDMKFLHLLSPPPPPHPLEMLPDLEGDNKGAAGRGKQSSVHFKLPSPEQPLPPELRVPLGRTLAVGDLEVTPEKVERRRPAWLIGQTRELFPEDVLALTLKLRNRSADVTFKPMDRFFARSRPTSPSALRQYTLLEMGEHKFVGGPLRWVPLTRKATEHIEYVEGQTVNQELKPGEQMTTFVCTNPDDHAVKELEDYQGPLLWRVQLRRGLVHWTTREGVERDDPATAVVGVEFGAADVARQAVN